MHTICMHTKGKVRGAPGAPTALRRLKSQIALNREFRGAGEAAFLALVWTWQRLEAAGREFFPRFGITDVQFNVLMILWDYRERPLRQHELAEILVVNRASAGGVIARLERSGWISRHVDDGDTRARLVRLTRAGIAKVEEVRGPYYRLLARVFRDSDGPAHAAFIDYLDEVRSRLSVPHPEEEVTRRGSSPRARSSR
jgi:DNA-binding MarR family transcriptional regulator